MEEVLFFSLHIEKIPVELSTHLSQSLGLLSFSIHATQVHPEKDHRGQAEISNALVLISVSRFTFKVPGLKPSKTLNLKPSVIHSDSRYPHSFWGHRLMTPPFACFSTKNG